MRTLCGPKPRVGLREQNDGERRERDHVGESCAHLSTLARYLLRMPETHGHFPRIDLDHYAREQGVDLASALEALRAIYAGVDDKIAENTRGLDLPCRRGCSDCCHESVFLTPLEFFGAWDHVQRTVDDDTRSLIVARGLAIYARERARIDAFLAPPPDGDRDHFRIAKDLRFTCPLLDDDGGCRAYPMREILGRVFGCTWNDDDGGLYACHLVATHLADRVVTLGRARQTARLLHVLPMTGMRQVYPWYIHALYGEESSTT